MVPWLAPSTHGCCSQSCARTKPGAKNPPGSHVGDMGHSPPPSQARWQGVELEVGQGPGQTCDAAMPSGSLTTCATTQDPKNEF